MENGRISVVLPVYGVEKYLDRCVTSIVNQTYRNLEIILVDDGSKDNCPAICDAWAERDARIKVVHKANAGLGMARNTGIEHATGEYICFFDSDDYVALDTIEKAYRLAESEQSEIVLFGMSNVDRHGNRIRSIVPQTDKTTYTGLEIQRDFLPDLIAGKKNSPRNNLYMSAWVCLYSMNLIHKHGWRFASERDIISEDVYSLLCLYRHVERVSVLPEALYFYCENETSLTHTYRKDRFERICHFHKTVTDKAKELQYGSVVADRLQEPFLSDLIAAMKMVVGADVPETEKRKTIHDMVNSDYMKRFEWSKERHDSSLKRALFCFLIKKRCALLCYLILKL